MKRFSLPITILILIVAGCKNKTGSDDHGKTAYIAQALGNKKESAKIIRIKAKPDSLAMNASNTAIIVVDMENDFCTKGGMMDRAGNNISVIQKIIDPI